MWLWRPAAGRLPRVSRGRMIRFEALGREWRLPVEFGCGELTV